AVSRLRRRDGPLAARAPLAKLLTGDYRVGTLRAGMAGGAAWGFGNALRRGRGRRVAEAEPETGVHGSATKHRPDLFAVRLSTRAGMFISSKQPPRHAPCSHAHCDCVCPPPRDRSILTS